MLFFLSIEFIVVMHIYSTAYADLNKYERRCEEHVVKSTDHVGCITAFFLSFDWLLWLLFSTENEKFNVPVQYRYSVLMLYNDKPKVQEDKFEMNMKYYKKGKYRYYQDERKRL